MLGVDLGVLAIAIEEMENEDNEDNERMDQVRQVRKSWSNENLTFFQKSFWVGLLWVVRQVIMKNH